MHGAHAFSDQPDPSSICDNLFLLRGRIEVDVFMEALLFVICHL